MQKGTREEIIAEVSEKFVRLTVERKSKPSKTELLKILKKKGVRPIEFTIPNPFGI